MTYFAFVVVVQISSEIALFQNAAFEFGTITCELTFKLGNGTFWGLPTTTRVPTTNATSTTSTHSQEHGRVSLIPCQIRAR